VTTGAAVRPGSLVKKPMKTSRPLGHSQRRVPSRHPEGSLRTDGPDPKRAKCPNRAAASQLAQQGTTLNVIEVLGVPLPAADSSNKKLTSSYMLCRSLGGCRIIFDKWKNGNADDIRVSEFATLSPAGGERTTMTVLIRGLDGWQAFLKD